MSLLNQYINDLTNGCAYLDQLIASGNTDKKRINDLILGIEYQLNLPLVVESLQDTSIFTNSVDTAKAYLNSF